MTERKTDETSQEAADRRDAIAEERERRADERDERAEARARLADLRDDDAEKRARRAGGRDTGSADDEIEFVDLIRSAGDLRDARADGRDIEADQRDAAAEAEAIEYGPDYSIQEARPFRVRRQAADDRAASKADRLASREDRSLLSDVDPIDDEL